MDYPCFTFQPDFTKQPTRRVSVLADVLNLSAAKQFLAWPETQPQQVTQWTFSGESDTERASFSGFFEQMGGRAGVFLMPSYSRDLTLATLPAIGAYEVAVEGTGYGTTYLADSYPDRDGKYLFVLCPVNGVHISRVLRAVDSSGNSILTFEQRIPWAAAEGAMIGFARLTRFEIDNVEFIFGNEQHWSATMATRTVRVTVDCTREIPLSDGASHLLWKPFTTARQELKPAERIVYSYGFSLGPEVYATPQGARMNDTWAAWLGSDGVRIAKRGTVNPFTITDGDGVLSRLTDRKIKTEHLSLAFDENCNEVIAFSRHDEATVEIRGLVADVVTSWTFDGFSPQLFQFWTIDNEAYDLGDAEIVCIYAKRGTAGLYGRFESENFATERLLGSFPNVPLRIEYVEINDTTLTVVCIDDGHREMVLTADYSYLTTTPPPPAVHTTEGMTETILVGYLTGETVSTEITTTRSTETFTTSMTVLTYSTTYIQTSKPTLYTGETLEPDTFDTLVTGETISDGVTMETMVAVPTWTYLTGPTLKTTYTFATTTVIITNTTYTDKTTTAIYTEDTTILHTFETIQTVLATMLTTTEWLTTEPTETLTTH